MALLRRAVEDARADVAATRRLDGLNRGRLVDSQRHLLSTLEVYVEALEAAGLAPHWHMRAEVELLRGITADTRKPFYHHGVRGRRAAGLRDATVPEKPAPPPVGLSG
jgi:hypothetical protein